jgi:ADP-heptose:LPS heptosyltransferase
VDPEEKLWAHLRSLPFTTVLRLYAELVPRARRAGLQLIDLTRYGAAETRALQRYTPTLQLLEPSLSSLADTARLILNSQAVITVDTALVHLAGWFEWPTLLLLHQHPDERWQPLLKGRGEQQQVRILQQGQYNQWADLPEKLVAELQQWTAVAV